MIRHRKAFFGCKGRAIFQSSPHRVKNHFVLPSSLALSHPSLYRVFNLQIDVILVAILIINYKTRYINVLSFLFLRDNLKEIIKK